MGQGSSQVMRVSPHFKKQMEEISKETRIPMVDLTDEIAKIKPLRLKK